MVTTSTDTYRTRANTMFGVDISSLQGTVDFNSLKNDGVKWAIIRAYGSKHEIGGDTMFEKNVSLAKIAGIPTGGYYYAIPNNNTTLDAQQQADLFIAKLQKGYGVGKYGDLIPMIDVEDDTAVVPTGVTPTVKMPVADLLNWVNDFRNYFEDKTGVQLGIYTGNDFVKDHSNFNEGITPEGNILKDMPLWVAAYVTYKYTDAPLPGGWKSYVAWQYDYRGTFAGIPSGFQTDLNIAPTPFALYSKQVVPTETLVTDTTVATTTDTTKTDISTTTVVTTTTTTTTTKVKGKKYK